MSWLQACGLDEDVFHDQTAVVTGATSGIGQAVALALKRAGAKVWLVGRRLTDGPGSSCVDLSDVDQIERLGKTLRSSLSQVDILVHAAGVLRVGPLEQATAEDLDMLYKVNLRAPFLLTKALLPLLRVRPGQVVFVNSSVGLTAKSGAGLYSATKYGLRALADSLRQEVNADGIRVISIFPGKTATPMHEADKQRCPERFLQPSDVAASILYSLAVPFRGELTDLALRPLRK